MNFTALVVVGNGDGVVGFATGKGKDVSLAVEKAYARASRSLVYVERFEKSFFHAQEAKHCKTKIRLMPAKAGRALRCNQIVESICEMAGISDLSAKVIVEPPPGTTPCARLRGARARAEPRRRRRRARRHRVQDLKPLRT